MTRGNGSILGQITEGFVLRKSDQTIIRGHFTYNDTQQRGLACAVNTYDSSLLIILYVE